MNYCPHCAELLTKITEVCPHCNKAISPGVLQSLYEDQKTSKMNLAARRKIWFREHALYIIPAITLVAGFIVGMIITYGYAQIEFSGERENYQVQIAQFEATIAQNDVKLANANKDFQDQLNQKNEIIAIMAEEMDIMGKAMNFTIRLARNSTITPGTVEESEFYKRNIQYLVNQFNLQQEKLQQTGYENVQNFNLITIPQLMSE